MARPQHYFDWQRIVDEQADDAPTTSTRRRLRVILALFAAASAIIFARAIQLEVSDGDNFRRLATRPLEKTVAIPAQRGRILARDGTVLAADRKLKALAIQFRYLENPPNAAWLDRMTRARLPRAKRSRPERVAAVRAAIRVELANAQGRLAKLCGLSPDEWQTRTGRIQWHVDALATAVERRRLDRQQEIQERVADPLAAGELGMGAIVAGLFAPPEPLPPRAVILAEQVAYHRVVDDLPAEAALEIEKNPQAFPGAKVVEHTRREYPAGSLAAHLVGHVSPSSGVHFQSPREERTDNDDDPTGRMGTELKFEPQLRGRAGVEVQSNDRRGKVLAVTARQNAVSGQEVVLTIDPRLQAGAEQLLDRAARRLDKQASAGAAVHGGAVVVMDVRSGEVLVAASAPRFDPNRFAHGDPQLDEVLGDPRQPLFDRVTKMAIPPGSVFKPLVALALLENGVVDRERPFRCRGYWDEPDRLRCQIFRQHGIGHGDVTLADALAQSCNVYFFHHADQLGAEALIDWAARFGFGDLTGIDLPDEASGQLPSPARLRQPRELQAFAIGQGAFTATPLAVARMYAAIANGGHLITPVLTRDRTGTKPMRLDAPSVGQLTDNTRIAGLTESALAAVREGLRRAVDDPNGTAFATVRLPGVAIVGKTGTAQTGEHEDDHAWFAGYVPADAPRYVLVVVVEHGGSGATIAGSAVQSLVQMMQQLEYFGPIKTADAKIPPGKG
jgi:penicillin-binding protein 2